MKQIKCYGLGGQGVVTGAKLLAEAIVMSGKYAQTTPAYGHERRGAPVTADVFASEQPIKVKCYVFQPNVVVLFGTGVLNHSHINVTAGADKDVMFIVNARPDETLPFTSPNIYRVDALTISQEETGIDIPNAAMLGAIAAAGLADIEVVADTITKKFGPKGGPAGAKAARRAYAETRHN
jgi:pyruvate ferredoxin oxidoreductase gamma subunit